MSPAPAPEVEPLPPLIRVDIDGIRQTLLHHLTGFGGAWAEMTKKAIEALPLQQMVTEAVRREAATLIQDEVKRQLQIGASGLVREALGKDKYAQALRRIEVRVRKEAEAVWEEERASQG